LDTAISLASDRVLTFEECRQVLGISKATFHRRLRHKLPVVQLSDRRFGVRLSSLQRFLDSREIRAV
jgi:predicted DNA-binding transcriptional regulator AlpA